MKSVSTTGGRILEATTPPLTQMPNLVFGAPSVQRVPIAPIWARQFRPLGLPMVFSWARIHLKGGALQLQLRVLLAAKEDV